MINIRSFLVFAFDLAAVLVAWIGAFVLRFNLEWPRAFHAEIFYGALILMVVQLAACRWAGLYRGMWSFASLPDLRRLIRAVGVSVMAVLALAVFDGPWLLIPRSIVLLYPLLLIMMMGGGRIAWRLWKESRLLPVSDAERKPVVIVGAGTAGAMLLRELARSPDWKVVALVDDDRHKRGLELSGCRVEGATADLPDILQRYGARHVILAMPSASAEALQAVTRLATQAGAALFTIPGLAELMSGRVAINMMRPVKIEDLLGRESVRIDNDNVRAMLTGKRILVTGAGGSIGSELCRQLSRFEPACIVLLETSEFALYMIEQWFGEHRPEVPIVRLAGDVKDESRMAQVFAEHRPQVVFHAAAYKHVPLMEVGNAWQAVRNNVLGTLVVARAARDAGADRFVLISTDKAVNPTNVMGATKRIAEMVCEVLQNGPGTTRFHIVRFGNVLGSTGSVIPKFQAQIAHGGPVTVTHPEINRYFMSIPEAAQLVLQAAAMGQGGEIFVLDMGAPVKIVDLARNMIRLSGFTEDEIHIEFTGLRPGEKLYEELLADAEETLPTPHEKLRIARSRAVPDGLYDGVLTWLAQAPQEDEAVRTGLKRWVPEYEPRG
ncbi:nucleoside-diphosphate sugar epimerase/dehydratase [Castellaniella denitrificans]|uniref:Nucleoside-diphosphate sugar epimerase/dehydratase n=1 Tax=Castellaniella denitrificans TaxID=56119 RepID=A0ABT4LZR1_9BURK|nr:nucleoside-diphosphate sugar epimerase/dehydratase [Castellaniella denitrificans]MCZ4328547.1 nucleoside-diphosphate sugar epimerase/dehydratase [Castellaniella denitrificans]